MQRKTHELMVAKQNALPFYINLYNSVFEYLPPEDIRSFALSCYYHAFMTNKSLVVKLKKLKHISKTLQDYHEKLDPIWKETLSRSLGLLMPPHNKHDQTTINHEQWEKNLNAFYKKIIDLHRVNKQDLFDALQVDPLNNMPNIVTLNPQLCKLADTKISRFGMFNRKLPKHMIDRYIDTSEISSERNVNLAYKFIFQRGGFIVATSSLTLTAFILLLNSIFAESVPEYRNETFFNPQINYCYPNKLSLTHTYAKNINSTYLYNLGLTLLGFISSAVVLHTLNSRNRSKKLIRALGLFHQEEQQNDSGPKLSSSFCHIL